MNRSTIQLSLLAGIIAVPGLLFAQPPGRGGPQGGMRGGPPSEMILQSFNQADANNDGNVTAAELTTAMQHMERGNQRRRAGPPRQQAGNGEQHGSHGYPPKPGQVVPQPIAESLNLNEGQTRQLAALQADVDKRLAAILTDEQKEQLQNARPPQGRSQ